MLLAAHQPQFMPWPGYFAKIRDSSVFVLLDDVQYKKNEWQNRNKIWTSGGPQWLTVPVAHNFGDTIRAARVNNLAGWKQKHLKTLSQSYSKAANFSGLMPELENFYAGRWESLAELNSASVRLLAARLGIKTRLELLSENPVEGTATVRLVNLCRKFGADTYLAGAGGKDYMDMNVFADAGIKVIFQNYVCPVYKQFGGEFVPNLSALDLLFHAGDSAREIL